MKSLKDTKTLYKRRCRVYRGMTENEQTIHPSFRVQAKHFSLTYPQFSCDRQEIFAFFATKGDLKRAIVAIESHQDGNKHLHVYLEYQRKINIKRQSFFDFMGAHPNLQATRNPNAWINYCRKEDKEALVYGFSEQPIINLFDLARETPEEEYFEKCRTEKGIHPS